MIRLALVALVLMALASQATENLLKQKIRLTLEQLLASEAKGIENCQNKCDKAFNRLAYSGSVSGTPTFEFQACVQGCTQCQTDLANNAPADNCFRTCKNTDWKATGLVKGVIEPDKACMGGCIIQTCQVICKNGTTDATQTPQNKQFFWPHGGCSIKTEPYSQYLEYVPFNSPNTGQGGSQDAAACCSNALSLCEYVGPTTTTNYQQLLFKTGQFCTEFVPSGVASDICTWFTNPQNCGTSLGA